ncbi:hypothetical protein LguiB_004381 [Lonicera macranthoides]
MVSTHYFTHNHFLHFPINQFMQTQHQVQNHTINQPLHHNLPISTYSHLHIKCIISNTGETPQMSNFNVPKAFDTYIRACVNIVHHKFKYVLLSQELIQC